MSSGSQGSVLQALNLPLPVLQYAIIPNSSYDMLTWASGTPVLKTQKLSGNGLQTNNLYQVLGSVLILSMRAEVTTVTDSTTLTGVKFEIWDGALATDICLAVDGSGVVEGATFYRQFPATSALVLANPTTGLVAEAGPTRIMFAPFAAIQKTGGVATYIRITYTGDANTDVDIIAALRFFPMSTDGFLTAV
jgi:hypothetical protein